MAAQAAHASNKVLLEFRDHDYVEEWLADVFTKIVVSVNSEEELLDVFHKASAALLPRALIKDAGRTEFHGEPTYTAVAIGPAPASLLDPITGHLPLL